MIQKKILVLALAAASAGFVSCASFQSAAVADYNGDGVISDAEYKQFQKQKNIEDRSVYSEGVKQQHAVDSVGRVGDGLYEAHRIRSLIRAF